MAIVDVFDRGGLFEAGILQSFGQGSILSLQALGIDQHAQPFLKAKGCNLGLRHLFLERLHHSRESQRVEFLNRLLVKHLSPPSRCSKQHL